MTRSAFGQITKRSTNIYQIRWTGRDGKRRSETVHGPKHVAQKRLSEIQLGVRGLPDGTTYGAYWESTVLPSLSMLAENTQHEYKTVWSRFLEPVLSDEPMSTTTWQDVEQLLSTIESSSMQRKTFRFWRKMLNMAIRDRVDTGVTANPCDKAIHLKPHVKRHKTILEAQDVKGWMESIRGIKYEALLLAMAGSGMRPGEAIGLTWDKIDDVEVIGEKFLKVTIDSTVTLVDNKMIEKGTKNASSNRIVLIGEPFASRLRELRSEGYLVSNKDGSPTSPATIAHNWKRWCINNGMEHVTLENLRTSYSVMCGEAGCIDSLVDFQLGHAGATTRAKNYQLATLKGLALVASTLAEYIAMS